MEMFHSKMDIALCIWTLY